MPISIPAGDAIHLPDARRVERMPLGDSEPGPVELGPAPGSGFDGESRPFQPFEEPPPGAVDGCGIPERALGPGEDLRQQIRSFCQMDPPFGFKDETPPFPRGCRIQFRSLQEPCSIF